MSGVNTARGKSNGRHKTIRQRRHTQGIDMRSGIVDALVDAGLVDRDGKLKKLSDAQWARVDKIREKMIRAHEKKK